MATKNKNLHKANKSKNDEFYTQRTDIEKEVKHYKKHFKDKVVFCNCDDPNVSNFFKYFADNFEHLGLKRLITTCYKNNQPSMFSEHNTDKAVYLEYTGEKDGGKVPTAEQIGIKPLKGDGDFRSDECIELLEQADIVVTNPPFSLFREYVTQLAASGKKFLIIGNQNAITYKETFKLIKDDKMWLGYSQPVAFVVPDDYEMREVRSWRDENGTNWRSLGNACWFTNLDIAKRHEDIILYKNYNAKDYPQYDNYPAIEVSKVADTPVDYAGVMGVPITFLDKYNPAQFEIIGNEYDLNIEKGRGYINGKRIYSRIFVKNKKPQL